MINSWGDSNYEGILKFSETSDLLKCKLEKIHKVPFLLFFKLIHAKLEKNHDINNNYTLCKKCPCSELF